MSKFCPECNTENEDTVKFCRKCGTPLNSAQKIENNDNNNSSNNTLKIAILAILCIIVIAGAFVLLSNTSQEITVNGIDFNIPAGLTENEYYAQDNVKTIINGVDIYTSASGFEDESKENGVYIMVYDTKDVNLKDEDIEDIFDSEDYEKKTINGQDGLLVPKSEGTDYIMSVPEPVYIFAYEKNGDMVLIGATDKSYFSDVII